MIEVGAPERAAAAALTLGTGAGAGGAVTVADGDAFASWYRTEHPRLLATMTIVTRDLHAAQDITAEAFARALAAWHRVSAMDSPTGWTYRVALNLGSRCSTAGSRCATRSRQAWNTTRRSRSRSSPSPHGVPPAPTVWRSSIRCRRPADRRRRGPRM